MMYKITTNHADYETLFGGPSIAVEHVEGACIVRDAKNAALIGAKIEITEPTGKSDGSDIAEQLAAMYSAEVAKMYSAEFENLDELFDAMCDENHPRHTNTLNQHGQWSSILPTFGGEPAHDISVWSWDETRIIFGTCNDDLKIIDR